MRYKRVGCGLVVEREVRTEIIATPSYYVIIPNGKLTPAPPPSLRAASSLRSQTFASTTLVVLDRACTIFRAHTPSYLPNAHCCLSFLP